MLNYILQRDICCINPFIGNEDMFPKQMFNFDNILKQILEFVPVYS